MLTADEAIAYAVNAEAEAKGLNASLAKFYMDRWNAKVVSVAAGRLDATKTDWPDPPKAYTVSSPDTDGFVYVVAGTEPVCPKPTVPANPGQDLTQLVANQIDVGKPLGGNWYAAGPLDTWPPNKLTPPVTLPDGTTHRFLKIPAPVGSQQITLPDGTVVVHGGWYESQG